MDNEATITCSSEKVYETNEHQKKPSEKGSDSEDRENNILAGRGDQEETRNPNESDPTSEDIELKWDDDLDDENDQTTELLDDLELTKPATVGFDDVSHTCKTIFKTKDVTDEGQGMDIDSPEDVESVLDKAVKSPEMKKIADEEVSTSESMPDPKNNDEFTKLNTDVAKKSVKVDVSEKTDNNDSNPNIDLDETTKEVETFLLELENNESNMKDHESEDSITDSKNKQLKPVKAIENDSKNTDSIADSTEIKSLFGTATVDKNKKSFPVEFTDERELPKNSSSLDIDKPLSSVKESTTEPKLDSSKKLTELSVGLPSSSSINMIDDVKAQEGTLELPAKTREGDMMIAKKKSKVDQEPTSDAESTELPSKTPLEKKVDSDMDIENFLSSSVPIEATVKSELIETNDIIVSSEGTSKIDQDIIKNAKSTELPTKTPLEKKVDLNLDIENFIASSVPIEPTAESELIESNDMIDSSEEFSEIIQDFLSDAKSAELPTKTPLEKKVDLNLDIENFIASSVPIEATVKSELVETNVAYFSNTKDSTEPTQLETVKKPNAQPLASSFTIKPTNKAKLLTSLTAEKIADESEITQNRDDIIQKTTDITDQSKLSSSQDDVEHMAIDAPCTLTALSNEDVDKLSPSSVLIPSIHKDQASHELSTIQSLNMKEMASDLSEKLNVLSSTDLVQTIEKPIPSSSTEVDQTIKDPIPASNKDLEATDVPIQSSSIVDDQTIDDPIPSSSKEFDKPTPSTSNYQSTDEHASTMDLDAEQMAPDASDEIPEVTDSLGLLAESKVRVLDEEEDQEDDDDGDDEEDGDDDQDDESNEQQLGTAEHSEDSNQQTSETETPKDTPDQSENSFTGKLREKETAIDEETGESDLADVGGDKDEAGMDVDETSADKTPETPGPEAIVLPTIAAVTSVEMEIVKLSDTSDSEINSEAEGKQDKSILKEILVKPIESAKKSPAKDKPESPSKKKLEISQAKNVLNIVDLEESSSEDDIQEVNKAAATTPVDQPDDLTNDDTDSQVTTVNIPKEVDIISAATGTTLELEDKEGETVIKGVPKPVTNKKAKLNTSEISIKTATALESTLVIPETKVADIAEKQVLKPNFGLEVFNLDSDDENSTEAKQKVKLVTPPKPPSPRLISRCVNPMCTSDASVDRVSASAAILRFYDVSRRRKAKVCRPCADCAAERSFGLVEGVMSMCPLLEIEMSRSSQQLVEISDSDSDGEQEDATTKDADKIGVEGATLLEEQLADIINSTWRKYNLDDRLKVAKDEIDGELEKLEKERLEIDAILNTCQAATDKLRLELYATFNLPNTRSVPAFDIMDTPFAQYSTAVSETESNSEEAEVRRSKRKTTLGPKKESIEPYVQPGDAKDDDNTDIKVVKLSAEVAPVDLPPSGTLVRPALISGQTVFAMRHAFGSWLKGIVQDIYPKGSTPISAQFTVCKVRFEHKVKNPVAQISARHMAYPDPANVRLTIGTRVIALFSDIMDATKRRSYYSGVIAEMPNPVNSYRYLVFFDDGYAQYVTHTEIRVVCECSSLVWEEVHPFSREFVRQYLVSYPERPMVRLHAGQSLKTEWNGKWWVSKVIKVDASLVQIHFEADDRTEWIYRGSTRLAPLYLELQNAERPRARPLPRSTQHRINTPYVEYTRSDEQEPKAVVQAQKENEDFKKQRAVAKKSTALPTTTEHRPPPVHQQPLDNVMSRVVYYTPKAAVKPHKMYPHTCSPKCKRTDVLPLKELRTYNPLARPLLSGWERQILRFKGRKEVMYRAPCGRRLRDLPELHRYLRATNSEMGVELFDFAVNTHCLAEFVLNRCLVSKKDLSHGKENVPVPCVNYYDNSLPEFCSYNTERTPTAGVPLNLDPDFLCGCDCTDDCQDKSKCACWKMTLDGAHTIGMDIDDIGYVYKRLLDPVPSGIYECNSRCKCKQTCLNRVAQHPLQLKLQVFKTLNRGWGIRALNDVPRGSFLCVYAGNLLTDATANLDGLNEGDEYLAELDYIEVVEQMKEGYEGDIPDKDKELDKKKSQSDEEDQEESSSSEDERREKERERQDNDFRPAYEIPTGCLEFNKRLRKRDKKKKDKNKGSELQSGEKKRDDCITISDDDEEVREPQRFTAQAGMGANDFISKHKSVRTLFGKDEACYIMDAKVQGNIGRYLNHSCTPNVFVQNVFVDTHDPRFPWVAFFALSHIRAGTELTWNYNYDVGSVPGKILYCYCGASNCRGRLL